MKLPPHAVVDAAGRAVILAAENEPLPRCIGDRFRDGVAAHPCRPFLTWLAGDTIAQMTWSEVLCAAERRSGSIAHFAGLDRRIGIQIADRVDWVVTMLACLDQGVALVPMPPGIARVDVARRARSVGVRAVITDDGHGGADDAVLFVPIGDIESGCERSEAAVVVDPDSPALIQFTSGTTGSPKAAVLSHRAVLSSALLYAYGTGAGDGGIFFNPLPLDHVGGSVAGVIAAVAAGGTYTVTGRFDPAVAIEMIRRLRPTVVGLVPTMVVDILDHEDVVPEDFASVVSVVGGATTVDTSVIDEIEERAGIRFLVGYGQSEAPCMALSRRDDPAYVRTRTLGRVLPGRDYCLVGRDGEIVKRGEVGELLVSGPLTMRGYLQPDGSILDVRDDDGWIRTGDLCVLDVDDVLHFRARAREVIIRGGENIYPAEVEAVIANCPGVAEVAVVGMPDRRLGEIVIAVVRSSRGGAFDEAAADEIVSNALPYSHRPVRWETVEDFPRTATGKIRKAELIRLLSSSG